MTVLRQKCLRLWEKSVRKNRSAVIKDGRMGGENTHHIQEDVEQVGFEHKGGHVARQYGEVDGTCL